MNARNLILRSLCLCVFALIFVRISSAQGSQQIASRKIREVQTITTDNRKGQGETTKLVERYNKKGLIIERILSNGKDEIQEHELFEYGRKKRLIKHTTLDGTSGQPTGIRKYSFDKWGNEILEEHFGADNTLKQKIVSLFDNSGKKTNEEVYDGSGKLLKSTTNTYDDRGMLLLRTIKDANGATIYTKSNSYTY